MRWPTAAITGVALAGLVFAGAASIRPPSQPSTRAVAVDPAIVVASADLRFLDQADGSIAVIAASDGRLVDRVVGESGFVRGTLRGLARERKRQGVGPDAAFRLVARTDRRLTLLDPSTGRSVDLESFGPTNASDFARLLSAATSTHPVVGGQAPTTPDPSAAPMPRGS